MTQGAGTERALRRAEVVATLSIAADLARGMPLETGLRSCLLATRLASLSGEAVETAVQTFNIALLVYAGCTAESDALISLVGNEHDFSRTVEPHIFGPRSKVASLTIRSMRDAHPGGLGLLSVARDLPKLKKTFETSNRTHCEVAQLLSDRLSLRSDVRKPLACVFERWNGSGGPNHTRGVDIPLPTRFLHVAQAVVLSSQTNGEGLAALKAAAGRSLDPDVVQLFIGNLDELTAPADTATWDEVLAAEPGDQSVLTDVETDRALSAVAAFTDMKSAYTLGHSTGVADLARSAAGICRLPSEDVVGVYRAALIHDVGRVAVSGLIWEKKAPLNEDDWEKVRLHAYQSERITARSPYLARIGRLASMHHERLDGSGYHRGSRAPELSPAARILAAADAYQAMTQERPHRPSLNANEAASTLRDEVQAGRMDPEAVAAVLEVTGHERGRVEHPAGLTDREVEVLRLLARGLTTKQIGSALSISVKTADRHIQNLYPKLGVSTRAAAALRAVEHGIVR